MCEVRRRTASRWSRALPFPDEEADGDEDEKAAEVAIAMEENMETGGDWRRGGEEAADWELWCWWWW